jgi:hypothetical protein
MAFIIGTSTANTQILAAGTTAERPATLSAGQLRYNTSLGALETYAGTAWASLGGTALGTVGNPAASAAAIKSANPSATTGTYYILIGGVATTLWCDMDTDGGGWMSFAASPNTSNWFGGNTTANWSGLSYSSGTYNSAGVIGDYWRNYSQQSVTQVLFKTGNGTYWIRMRLADIYPGVGTTYTTNIATSNNFPNDGNNYNGSITVLFRSGQSEDPWINAGNAHAVGNNYMFWGENNINVHQGWKNGQGGIIAFVR